jgi:hypothetical protein
MRASARMAAACGFSATLAVPGKHHKSLDSRYENLREKSTIHYYALTPAPEAAAGFFAR